MLSKEQIDRLKELAEKAVTGTCAAEYGDNGKKFLAAFTDPQIMRELIAMLEAAQKDAARYRYVQDVAGDLCVCKWCEEDSSWYPLWEETPDKSIDEHMRRDCDGSQHAND